MPLSAPSAKTQVMEQSMARVRRMAASFFMFRTSFLLVEYGIECFSL